MIHGGGGEVVVVFEAFFVSGTGSLAQLIPLFLAAMGFLPFVWCCSNL